MVRGLISERSYPWTVEPAGLNGSIRHRLSGEGSGGKLERCLRWGRAGEGGLRRVVIRQLKMLGIVGFPIPTYDGQTRIWLI